MYPHVTQFETRERELRQEILPIEARRPKRGGGMLSYLSRSAAHEEALREQECEAMGRLRFERPARPSLSRRERKLLERHSVVMPVAAGRRLGAPSPHATSQFLLIEQGSAEVSVDGTPAGVLRPGDMIAHAPGLTLRAATDLCVRVLTPREHDLVKTIPALRERLVEPLPLAA
jgi:hypothetical protein